MSTTIDYIICHNCKNEVATRETNNTSGHVTIFCTCCGFNSDDRMNVCPKCTAGLSFNNIEENGALDSNGDFQPYFKTECMNEDCDYEGYAIMKMVFVCHSDCVPER